MSFRSSPHGHIGEKQEIDSSTIVQGHYHMQSIGRSAANQGILSETFDSRAGYNFQPPTPRYRVHFPDF